MAEDQATASASASSAAAASLGHSVIPIVNKLQDIFAQLGSQSTIELPQVAVVGSQSSGKSSVLEALVGRDFLPRGNDICTRRPLVLQLVQRKIKADGTDEEWGEFLHLPGKKFFHFNEIRREIQAETDREAGGNKGVSDKQIRLKIFSPNVLDITLVDLPGLTKDPVGDQPSDIEARIRTMIMSYIKLPSCLILAVTPANSDLANSDALQMLELLILTLDIMDRGTDARNFLLGKVIPLRLGYVGVVNRSQEDILMNRSIKDALIAEEKFFRSRPVYSDLAERCGVPQLAKKLNQILVQHIKTVLPGLKSRISAALVSVAKEHASYGEITESKAGQGALLLNILSKYSEAFSSMIEGKNEEMSTSELSGGARIHYIFQNIFVKSLEDVDPCEDLTGDDIRTAIQNATGPKSALFVPEVPFEVLVRRQIARLLDPSLQCARFIYDELIKMSHRCMVNELERFPVLRKRMDEVTGNFLREGLVPSETMIGHMIEMEMDYINTSHPNFLGGSKAVEMALQQVKSSKIAASISRQKDAGDSEKAPNSERSLKSRAILARQVNGIVPEQDVDPCEDLTGDDIRTAIQNATGPKSALFVPEMSHRCMVNELERFPVLRKRMDEVKSSKIAASISRQKDAGDSEKAPNSERSLKSRAILARQVNGIVPEQVNHTKRELHNVFIKKLYRDNLFEEMLQEPDEVSMKRKRTRDTLRVLQQAFRTLDELPLEAETVERGYSMGTDPTGLPKIHGLPTSSLYNTSSGSTESYSASPKTSKPRKSSHSGELHSPLQKPFAQLMMSSTYTAYPYSEQPISLMKRGYEYGFLQIARPVVDLQEFIYIVKIGIGTFKTKPSFKEFYLDMDTGSCFTWMQCQGCKKCFKQKPKPFPRNNLEMAPTLPGSP
ncbi:Dynamin-related protein 3A [Sesamum angolense]|uniref:Dynamin-related protein 3A n=1 Tax=Sesamum angolense TaxID=2727404 RepID=A0AAE1WYJ4_9LAMI|nr:Dynamin-related protein 3A [Sesamum angolense]